ncbi:DUF6089 family protein [Polaribacter porphyrae]|uniref:DUF6089 domain-containing protein n=1 Tax=Polaribacter porphyrae TaxID=1137780 RepID=A0A2S7WPL0_9FLAO|nr:DUF6089 family protein [Polaribacter porphyrae]PQJ79545.1 hypothetical protein BTO18_10340 [Polaribacter porphyrae]
MKKSILLIICLTLSNILFAQVYEAGITIGGSNYVGDIGRTNYIYPNKIAGAAFFKYNWNPRIVFRATYSYLPIGGNDLDADTDLRRARGLNFTNTIHELAIGLEYNFYEYNISEQGKTWTPYILLELGAFNYKYVVGEPQPRQYTFDTKNSFSIPFGVGFKSKLIGPLAFSIETKFRYTFEDDLDYTTSNFTNLDFGGTGNDWYMFTGISLIYTFGRPPCYTTGF